MVLVRQTGLRQVGINQINRLHSLTQVWLPLNFRIFMLENVSWALMDLAQETFVQAKVSLDAADHKMEGVHTA